MYFTYLVAYKLSHIYFHVTSSTETDVNKLSADKILFPVKIISFIWWAVTVTTINIFHFSPLFTFQNFIWLCTLLFTGELHLLSALFFSRTCPFFFIGQCCNILDQALFIFFLFRNIVLINLMYSFLCLIIWL